MPQTSILPQLIINGLIAGAIYALAASGFSLVYYVVKFLNFAQGAIITFSAYMFFLFFSLLHLSYILSGILSIMSSILLIIIVNVIVYKPLRKRKATNVVLMISSLALLIFSSSFVLAIFGSTTKIISSKNFNRTYDFGIFTITAIQTTIILSTLILFFILFLVLKKTKLGKAMRALADNKEAAQVVGINPERIYAYTFLIASVLGSIAGILIGLEQNLYPRMGVPLIVKGFISAVVGGVNSVPGAVIGGFFIGLAENLGIWFLPSGYKDVVSFAVLLLFLLIKPYGILGVKARDT
ncbi:branched-chain amino acid ABC transporter permease [Candidatus Woesearchaeota archaeon]|nr:branched-chain amino acid ABC transporter permease [Candidatus Woesearchaeota archaeon]